MSVRDIRRKSFDLSNDVVSLLQDVQRALQDYHEGTNTTRPFEVTYARDKKLLSRCDKVLKKLKPMPHG